jgi:glycosyltransferase 2 family protein
MRRPALIAAKAAGLVACVLLLARALASADWAGSVAHLAAIGPLALLVLVPFPIGMALDGAAWRALLAKTGHRVSLTRLFRVRMATEAVTIALPAGGLVTEALGPALLANDAPIGASFASSVAKRWLIIRTHGYYALFATALGWSLLGRGALTWIVASSALALVALSIATQAAAMRLGLAARVHGALARLRGSRVLGRFASSADDRASFDRVDASLRALGGGWHAGPSLALLGMWLFESVEAFVILRLLGAPVSYVDILAIEAALSVVRSAAVFAPAGLGVQDLGYLALFALLGIPDVAAIGPAFLVLKRAKEVFFVSLGVGLLVFARRATYRGAERASQPADGFFST